MEGIITPQTEFEGAPGALPLSFLVVDFCYMATVSLWTPSELIHGVDAFLKREITGFFYQFCIDSDPLEIRFHNIGFTRTISLLIISWAAEFVYMTAVDCLGAVLLKTAAAESMQTVSKNLDLLQLTEGLKTYRTANTLHSQPEFGSLQQFVLKLLQLHIVSHLKYTVILFV